MFTEPYLGTVTIFAGTYPPYGWMFCQGQSLPISIYTALYAVMGITFGGDGKVSFNLPDLRGRKAIHPGQGIGLSNNYDVGEEDGAEDIHLTLSNLAAHSHTPTDLTGSPFATSNPGTTDSPVANIPASITATNTYSSSPSGTSLGPSPVVTSVSPAGGNSMVPVIPPYVAMNYIIAVEGVYPTRN